MTCQGKRDPKTRFCTRITNENYDFLYRVARNGDKSISAALNDAIAKLRQSDINSCTSEKFHHTIREANYAR